MKWEGIAVSSVVRVAVTTVLTMTVHSTRLDWILLHRHRCWLRTPLWIAHAHPSALQLVLPLCDCRRALESTFQHCLVCAKNVAADPTECPCKGFSLGSYDQLGDPAPLHGNARPSSSAPNPGRAALEIESRMIGTPGIAQIAESMAARPSRVWSRARPKYGARITC